MNNLAVRLRELRSDCECGGYTIENNGVWANDNKTFLRDVLTALNDATRTINELLSADEVSDDYTIVASELSHRLNCEPLN